MEDNNQKCPFEILEKDGWLCKCDGKEINLVWERNDNVKKGKQECEEGYTVYIKAYRLVLEREGRNKIMIGLKTETKDIKYYPFQQRLYRELYGKYGGMLGDEGCIVTIDDTNTNNTGKVATNNEETSKRSWLPESLSYLILDMVGYVYKYDTIREVRKKLNDDEGFRKKWTIRTCFDNEYSFMGETDLAVEYKTQKWGQPYIDLTQFIDDKWKLWFFTRKDAGEGISKNVDKIAVDLNISEFNRIWRNGNDYFILDEFDNVSDWLCKYNREDFINTVVVRIKYWTDLISEYISPLKKSETADIQTQENR